MSTLGKDWFLCMCNVFDKFRYVWLTFARSIFIGRKLKKKVQNKKVSVISQNCVGGVVCHDCGLRFNSPTINLWIPAEEFVEFVKDLKKYLESPLVDISMNSLYPIGLLGGKIHIHFLHYESFENAKKKWIERAQRVNFENLRIVMTENDGCSYSTLQRFDLLPYKKIVLTYKKYFDIRSSIYIPGFERDHRVSCPLEWIGFFGKKYIDFVDWTHFLNGK